MRALTDSGPVDLDAAYWINDPESQFVRGVMVCSADGAAQADGKSGALGGPADKRLFALLRSHADVILVGSATVKAEAYGGDRPSSERCAWRLSRGLAAAPRMAVVTRRCDLDPAGPLFTDTLVRPVVVTCQSAPPDKVAALAGVADIVVAGTDGVEIGLALDQLADLGARRISCEGGPSLLAQVAAADRLDELALTIAPRLLAGNAGRVLTGTELTPPVSLSLVQVLHDDGFLFLRYGRGGSR